MLNKENIELCWAVLTKYGIENQQRMVIEECAELQKSVCKLFRDRDRQHGRYQINFVEELVDVIVMCQQMILAESISDEMLNIMAKVKLERALEDGKDKNCTNH